MLTCHGKVMTFMEYAILAFRLCTFERMFIKYHGKGSDVNQLIMFIEYHMYSAYSAIYTSYTSVSQRKSNILCLIYSGCSVKNK